MVMLFSMQVSASMTMGWYGQHLSEQGKIIYQGMAESFSRTDLKAAVISGVEYNDREISDAYQALAFDHPEYGLFEGCGYGWSAASTGNDMELQVQPSLSAAQLKRRKSLMKAITRAAAKIRKSSKSTAGRVKAINSYLRKNCSYDYRFKQISFEPYGALCKKKAVCMGYALAAQALCNEVGITSVVITGKGIDTYGSKENHAWNAVKIGKKWYALDITWNDTMGRNCYLMVGQNTRDVLGKAFKKNHKAIKMQWEVKSIPYPTLSKNKK